MNITRLGVATFIAALLAGCGGGSGETHTTSANAPPSAGATGSDDRDARRPGAIAGAIDRPGRTEMQRSVALTNPDAPVDTASDHSVPGSDPLVEVPISHSISNLVQKFGDALSTIAAAAPLDDGSHSAYLFPSASESSRQGFLRVINHASNAGVVNIQPIDDSGREFDTMTLAIGAGETIHFNSDDLENGNVDKGLTGATGAGQGDWRLHLTSELDIEVLAYIRTSDGFLTGMADIAPVDGDIHRIAIFNPGSNQSQVSSLRLINPGDSMASITIRGTDDNGVPSGVVSIELDAGNAIAFTAGQLENGATGLTGSLGDGAGKWRLDIESAAPIVAMSLLESPTDHLTNLSSIGAGPTEGVHSVALFPAAGDTSGRQGFLRVVNRSASAGNVSIQAFDDSPTSFPPITLAIDANQVIHFNSNDLELGNADKGLSGGVGTGQGDWRLDLSSTLDIEVLAYIRTSDGFLTAMHDVAPSAENTYRVAIFNPGSNRQQESLLRLVNTGQATAQITIAGIDGNGTAGASDVTLSLAANTAMTIGAWDLESGTTDVQGALGDGAGKWQLMLTSDQPIVAMSLLRSPTGHLTNLSTAPGREVRASTSIDFTAVSTIVQSKCINCHVEGGASGHTRLVFVPASQADHMTQNQAMFEALLDEEDADYVLNKIQGNDNHGGGVQVADGTTEFTEMEDFLNALSANDSNEDPSGDGGTDVATSEAVGVAGALSTNTGKPTFMSPHARPIAINGMFVYVANTPADTVDVVHRVTRQVMTRINVGMDPVSVVARPDGLEVWVSNHISDTISVIDTDPTSPTLHHVKRTVQAVTGGLATAFDEPVGIAFANSAKAYVALSPYNEIAVIDTATYRVVDRLAIEAQDPRALMVRGERLYVIPFESNNKTQISGCLESRIDGDVCTFDAVEHVFTNNNVLSTNYDADIVKHEDFPDNDLFIFNTVTDELTQTVESVGTLLYGLTVDSNGRVFVAQADARNDANGRAGTEKEGLAQLDNRAFLNQVTRINCQSTCGSPEFIDLEPLPPQHPDPGDALATPFGIQISPDDSTLVVTAAGSDKVFTLDPDSGAVLDRIAVGAVPRGIALSATDTGAPSEAWVLNAVDNSVSVIDVSNPSALTLTATVSLDDPTHPTIKAGRIAFNDADASTTGTFSCESCHPDGHTDQLVWVLDTPICDIDGCTQIPPRLTMPVRGLRDTAPYHWDGIPGDPYGGNNTANINSSVAPNCSVDDPASCTRVLVDGSLGSTMCDVNDCALNDEGKPGALAGAERDAMAEFLLSVPYPPAQDRAFDNTLSAEARDGFFEFSFINDASGRATGAQTCGACHKMPYLVSTNTPGTGMDAPTWRGAYDRFALLPQGRLNIIDLLDIVGMGDSFPERDMWILAGASSDIWEMVLEGSTGFPGGMGRQVTLAENSTSGESRLTILRALEEQAFEGALILQGEGVEIIDGTATPIALEYNGSRYVERNGVRNFTHSQLVDLAARGEMVVTLTGRLGLNVDHDHPPPALWPIAPIHQQTRTVEIAHLSDSWSLRVNGRHIEEGAHVFIDGRRIDATVRCEIGVLPACDDEIVVIDLGENPSPGGLHFLQVQNSGGLFSNDMMFYTEQSALAANTQNLITSGGSFIPGQWDENWNAVEIATDQINDVNGVLLIEMANASTSSWHAQISHAVAVNGGQEYTLCYDASANQPRPIRAYTDSNMDNYTNTSGGQFEVDLTPTMQTFSHTFTIAQTDLHGRVAFDFAQSAVDVRIDNIGLYEGDSCGTP